MEPKHILVVCHGNLFRSPLTEAILKAELPAERFTVESAGMLAEDGRPAPSRMQEWAREYGYSTVAHRSRRCTTEMVERATLILYMDKGNARRLRELAPLAHKHCVNLGTFIHIPAIPDPAFMRRDSVQFASAVETIVTAARAAATALNTSAWWLGFLESLAANAFLDG